MGAKGVAATSQETANVMLIGSRLDRLSFAIRLARATRSAVRENIAFSVAAVLLVTTSLGGWISLPVGVVAHAASALLVVLNAMRLFSARLVPLGEGRAVR